MANCKICGQPVTTWVVVHAGCLGAHEVHGRWIKESICSNCKIIVPFGLIRDPRVRYCPHCGAKMDAPANE